MWGITAVTPSLVRFILWKVFIRVAGCAIGIVAETFCMAVRAVEGAVDFAERNADCLAVVNVFEGIYIVTRFALFVRGAKRFVLGVAFGTGLNGMVTLERETNRRMVKTVEFHAVVAVGAFFSFGLHVAV